MKDWKACERRVAALLGGECVPVSGRDRGYSPNISHERLSIEVKSRRKLPAWIEDVVKQAEAPAQDQLLPVAVLHQDGRRYTNCLVMLRLEDFANHLKGGLHETRAAASQRRGPWPFNARLSRCVTPSGPRRFRNRS